MREREIGPYKLDSCSAEMDLLVNGSNLVSPLPPFLSHGVPTVTAAATLAWYQPLLPAVAGEPRAFPPAVAA